MFDDIVTQLRALDVPPGCVQPNAPAYILNGVSMSVSNLVLALSWALRVTRCHRRGESAELDYCQPWIRRHSNGLNAIQHTMAATLEKLAEVNDHRELARLDDALCDAIERLEALRGCGWHDETGKLHHRPVPFLTLEEALKRRQQREGTAPTVTPASPVQAAPAPATSTLEPRDPATVRTNPRIGDEIRFRTTGIDHLLNLHQTRIVEGLWDRWGQRGVLVGSVAGRTDIEQEFGSERWTLEEWSTRDGAEYKAGHGGGTVEERYAELLRHHRDLQDRQAKLRADGFYTVDPWSPWNQHGTLGNARLCQGIRLAIVDVSGWSVYNRAGIRVAGGCEVGHSGRHLADKCLVSQGLLLVNGVHTPWGADDAIKDALGKLISMVKLHNCEDGGFTNAELATLNHAITAIGGVP